jgi:hypothetical protein
MVVRWNRGLEVNEHGGRFADQGLAFGIGCVQSITIYLAEPDDGLVILLQRINNIYPGLHNAGETISHAFVTPLLYLPCPQSW